MCLMNLNFPIRFSLQLVQIETMDATKLSYMDEAKG